MFSPIPFPADGSSPLAGTEKAVCPILTNRLRAVGWMQSRVGSAIPVTAV